MSSLGFSITVEVVIQRAVPIATVIGTNARRLRGQHTTEELARAMTAAGKPWTNGRVTELEQGTVSPTLPTLLVLTQAFSDMLGRPVSLTGDLLAGDGPVSITSDMVVQQSELRAGLTGPVKPRGAAAGTYGWSASTESTVDRIARECGLTEERTARAFGVSTGRLVQAMADLWGHTLSVERDRLAGPQASQQKRGRITRQLREQLRKEIHDGIN